MKTLGFVLVLFAASLIGLIVLRMTEDVSVHVEKCVRDGEDALVTVRYICRLQKPVHVTFDLVLGRSSPSSQYGTGVKTVNRRHFSSVAIEAGEERVEVERVRASQSNTPMNAFVMNFFYVQ
jgi:hypothetical protein